MSHEQPASMPLRSRLAGVSIDVDGAGSHIDTRVLYERAVPRMLALLRRSGARATFFLIADDARRHPDMVAEISRRGHEVGSHSMTGAPAFGVLDEDARRLEVVGSKVLLESLAGRKVEGFRSPRWSPGRELLDALIGAGYVYDSSVQPFVLPPFRRLAGAAAAERGSLDLRPGVVRGERGALVELTGTATAGIPFNHAIRLAFPGFVSRLARHLACARPGSIGYRLHAVDVLGLDEDGLDAALGSRAGMGRSLDDKMAIASDSVARLARVRRVVPLRELVARDYGAAARPSRVDSWLANG